MAGDTDTSAEVVLHIYDLSQGLARNMSQMLLGRHIDIVPHTGVVLRGQEIFFGGGVQVMSPQRVRQVFNRAPVEALVMGRTSKTPQEVRAFLITISASFTARSYDLLRRNCNHFSEAVTIFLLGIPIPTRISEVPAIVMSTPFGAQLAGFMNGANDAFATAGGGGGGDPFAALEQAAAASEPRRQALAPPPPPPPPPAAAQPSQLPLASRPIVSASLASAGASIVRLKAAVAGSLSAADAALLDALPMRLAGADASACSGTDAPSASAATSASAAAWHAPTCDLVLRLLSDAGVGARAPAAALSLLRLLALREDCAASLFAGGNDAPFAAVLMLLSLRPPPAHRLPPALAALALLAAANAAASIVRLPAGLAATWARASVLPLSEAAAAHIARRSAHGAAAAEVTAAAAERRAAAALALNLVHALPARDDAGMGAGAGAGEGLADAAVPLLCALLDDEQLGAEADEEALRLRLLAAGRLLLREGTAARTLARSLELGAGALERISVRTAAGVRLRALAAEVAELLRK